MSAILPGATFGILGGGQLGRMTAQAARSMGFKVHVLDPDAECAARYVVDRCITAAFDDADAAGELARGCAVVTLEIEKIALASLRHAEAMAPVRPGANVLFVIQDRARQKSWLENKGFPVGPYRVATTASELETAARELGSACFAKAASGGYDGRGQVRIDGPSEATDAFDSLGGGTCVVEAALELEAEFSIMVARNPSGQKVVYPPALNHHENRILVWSAIPGPLPPGVAHDAMRMAESIAEALCVEGLLATEFFLLRDGRVLVNELAPRPHNSFHATSMACVTSQFEQLVRAACDLPLGAVDVVRPAAIMNLLGDLWRDGATPPFHAALAIPGVRLYLYGKGDARPGRKMGHLCAVGDTPEEAVSRVKLASSALGSSP
jgi:5-(carboxyamino)imidazole ribonucleotide synthase